MTVPAGPRVGRSIARVDSRDWSLHPVSIGPFQRPIDVRFQPFTDNLWVLDFGEFEINENGEVQACARSGNLWKISPGEYAASGPVSTANMQREPAFV